MKIVNILKPGASAHVLISHLSQQLNICMASDNLQRTFTCIISFDLTEKKYTIISKTNKIQSKFIKIFYTFLSF